jgi:hypothetical protein
MKHFRRSELVGMLCFIDAFLIRIIADKFAAGVVCCGA